MKKIIINENVDSEICQDLISEAFYPSADKVKHIKKYLDDNFARQELSDIDENGYPTIDRTVVMLSYNKSPLKTLKISELLLLLDDKFNNMISDDKDRKKFLKQVIKDWYFKRIQKNGLLSVNIL